MSESIQTKILSHLKSASYQPAKPHNLARDLELHGDDTFPAFRDALRLLMDQGRVVMGGRGAIVLPAASSHAGEIVGRYTANRRGFGFVTPSDPSAKEDLFIPPGQDGGALTGDTVRARIASRDAERGISGKIIEVIERGNAKFVGELQKLQGRWIVLPDGNAMTQPIFVPDAASRSIRPGTKVVVEITEFPENGSEPVGVITDVLGSGEEKDVDLRAIVIQHNLPGDFPDEVKAAARHAVDSFDPEAERERRLDFTKELILTIDPDDAKDYDDAISLVYQKDGSIELGVHIADVSHFVKEGTPLDVEAKERGNSTYFPGHVIPMLPEILSNGVCSLMEGVPRLCMSAFIVLDEDAKPVRTWFAQTIIQSAKRLRYKEAQDLIDGKETIFHPDGDKKRSDYEPHVIELLGEMDRLSKLIQKRRHAAGQLVLDLPDVELVLDEGGKVTGTRKEDNSFTHTLIEMFMVEANEAVARLLDGIQVPFIRRIHPEPDPQAGERLNKFVTVAGHKLPKEMDRHVIQKLVMGARGTPESYAINLAVLKSLARAEYSPLEEGHYALASTQYTHFTSPIRRYADLMIHRLIRQFLEVTDGGGARRKRGKIHLEGVPTFDELVVQGRHMSFTERRSEDAERELRKVKILELLGKRIGDEFDGVVTGMANFGIFVQIGEYLIEGVIRFEDLLDDWWDVDTHAGVVRGQRTGTRIGIGDAVRARVVRVDPARRELTLAISEITSRINRQEHTFAPNSRNGQRRGTGGGDQRTGGAGGNAGRGNRSDGPRRGGGGGGGRSGGSSSADKPAKFKAAGSAPSSSRGGGSGGGGRSASGSSSASSGRKAPSSTKASSSGGSKTGGSASRGPASGGSARGGGALKKRGKPRKD